MHRLPAAVKLPALVGLIVGVVLIPVGLWWAYAAVAGGLLGVALLSRLPLRPLVVRVLLLEPFVLGVALLAWFQPGGGVLFASMIIRSTLCLVAVVLVAQTTPFSAALQVLRRLHCPGLLVTTLALMHRYLFVLAEESQRMRRARASRTFTASRRRAWKSTASVAGQLFVRSTERAERIYAAMGARGWR